ncbi:hypothetical protein IWQ60_009231 [Tieghemiomyces parasiticus]|uniref:Glycoside hydrolase family 19 catalytic domain-containing protein n=1 Tax=Tieghemiomyces parasiticus TaxID=78921 RepID=A0A9W7ZYE5_9FUNG|nr:hypothetical protein IWQ60_009231 [Tieghemiomyces parasiticus]
MRFLPFGFGVAALLVAAVHAIPIEGVYVPHTPPRARSPPSRTIVQALAPRAAPSSNVNWATIMRPYEPNNDTTLIDCPTFNAAVASANYPVPNPGQCHDFREYLTSQGAISTTQEAAMFLAQLLWESNGLRNKEEIGCANNACPGRYVTDLDYSSIETVDGKKTNVTQQYYGRGYIQLTWATNYLAASKDIFGDDRLWRNPSLVATDEVTAWRTTFWFWKKNVHGTSGVQSRHFGAATNAINGALECTGSDYSKAQARYDLYTKVLAIVSPDATPNPSGCYPVDTVALNASADSSK